MMRSVLLVTLVLVVAVATEAEPLFAQVATPATKEPSADDVLRAADRILAPPKYTAKVKMTARRPDGSTREYAYDVAKSGDDLLKLTFTTPSTLSGHAALRRASELWRYVPSLKRAMRVSGRADFESGDFRNADVLRLQLARDYRATKMTRVDDTLVLDLVATSDEAAYDAMKLTVRAHDFMPLREELYGASGKLLRVLECREPKDFGSHVAPSVLLMTNMIAQGRSTEMVIQSLTLVDDVPDSWFRVEGLGR